MPPTLNPLTLTPAQLEFVLALDDPDLLDLLRQWLHGRQFEETNYSLLYQPGVLARLAVIYANTPDVWESVLAPALRRHRQFDYGTFVAKVRHVGQATTPYVRAPVTVCLADVVETPMTWLWYPYISVGTLTMLDGDPGVGKSHFTLLLATALSRGWPLPDQYGIPSVPVRASRSLFLALQDSLATQTKPRARLLGADMTAIHVLQGWNDPQDADGDIRPVLLTDLDILDTVLTHIAPSLVVIDPIQAYLGAKVDMYRANETNVILAGLRRLAEKHQCAVVCVRHLTKGGGGKAQHRGLGSVDFSGEARSCLFVEQNPSDKREGFVAHAKTNQGPFGRTQVFSARGGFQWVGVSRMDAELLAGTSRGPDAGQLFEAVRWLEKRLEGGVPVPSKDLELQAEGEDIRKMTLVRAKKVLGVVALRQGDGWYCKLPGLEPLEDFTRDDPPVQGSSEGHYADHSSMHVPPSRYSDTEGQKGDKVSDSKDIDIDSIHTIHTIHTIQDIHDIYDSLDNVGGIQIDSDGVKNMTGAQRGERISSGTQLYNGPGGASHNENRFSTFENDSQNEKKSIKMIGNEKYLTGRFSTNVQVNDPPISESGGNPNESVAQLIDVNILDKRAEAGDPFFLETTLTPGTESPNFPQPPDNTLSNRQNFDTHPDAPCPNCGAMLWQVGVSPPRCIRCGARWTG